MKRKCYSWGCLVVSYLLFLQAGCQKQAELARESSSAPIELKESQVEVADAPDKLMPVITFEKSNYNFGDVSPNSTHTGKITFTNTGRALLKITKIERCCGVVANVAKGKMEYAPGERGTVNLQWRFGSYPGAIVRKLVIHSNDRINPITTLNIHAKIVLKITWEPRRLRLSPTEVNAGCSKLTISSLDDRPFSITQFQSTGGCLTADIDPSVSATRHIIDLKVDIERLQKNPEGRINISTTHPEGGDATIFFEVLPEYTMEPPSILIFNAESGSSVVAKLVLLNNYGHDFEIESVSSMNSTVAVNVLRKTKIRNGYRLEVEMTVPPNTGKGKFTDEFSINLKSGRKLLVKCNGYYKRNTPRSQTR
jgi:hypothetical protein